MKTITHIASQRTEGIINPLLIQQQFEMTEMEHKQFIYDLGCKFLHEFYTNDLLAISIIEKLPHYWRWFRNEFLQWENDLVTYIEVNNLIAEQSNYKEIITQLMLDQLTFESYLTFLKIYKKEIQNGTNCR